MYRSYFAKQRAAILFSLLVILVLAFVGVEAHAQQKADLILYNGKIVTVDSNFSMAQAVAISGNKIAAVGQDDEVLKLAGPNTSKIDLKGRTVIPGIIDTHRHIESQAESAYTGSVSPVQMQRFPVDWRGVRTKDDVLNQIKGIMDKYNFKPGQWIYFDNLLSFMGEGGGEQLKVLYNDLNRRELDKVTPNNPAVFTVGIPLANGALLNGKAIDLVWKKHGDLIKKYGRYWIDQSGKPEGHVEQVVTRYVEEFVGPRPPEVLGPIYKKNLEEISSMGMTTVATRLDEDAEKAYEWLESKGQMTFRLSYSKRWVFGQAANPKAEIAQYRNEAGSGNDKIWVSSVAPSAVDGSTSRACTNLKRKTTYAALDNYWPMGQCYTDQEYLGAAGRSAPIKANYFKEWVLESGRQGVRVANDHVAGDRSHSNMLDMIEQIQREKGPEATKGWAMDHCDMINPKDFPRIARTGVTMSCYVLHSVNAAANLARAYGDDVGNTFPSPLKSILDAGGKVVLESDSASYIWQDLQAAVTRKDRNGKVWGPQDRVDRPTALRMLTSWAAVYVLRGDKIGSLETGKLADLVVLDQDYLTVPEDTIEQIQPQLTVFDGKIIFVHSRFAEEYNLKPAGALISTYPELIKRRTAVARAGG